jgi:hypothetical protein
MRAFEVLLMDLSFHLLLFGLLTLVFSLVAIDPPINTCVLGLLDLCCRLLVGLLFLRLVF